MENAKMIRIGEMSKMVGVSLDTLRHYDRIGLLKPYVDPANGYRYYAPEQIITLKTILIAKQAGIHLERLKAAIEQESIQGQLGMMRDIHSELLRKMQELDSQLNYSAQKIKLLERISGFENDLSFQTLKEERIDLNIYRVPRVELNRLLIYPSTLEESEGIEQWCIYGLGQELSDNPEGADLVYFVYAPSSSLQKFEDAMKELTTSICCHFSGRYYKASFWGTTEALRSYLEAAYAHFGLPSDTLLPIRYCFSLHRKAEEALHFTDLYFPAFCCRV